ncbi:ester cyclase [Candidatus Bipolaricaulota bacterium]|nr:ester cyclase [Candidatus Bipolaricaulota bacterium]
MSEKDKTLVRRFVEECQSQRDLDRLPDFISSEFVNHTAEAPLKGTFEGAKQLHEMLFTAFPDMKFVIRDMVAEADKVVTYKTLLGTHQGDFMGIPPTGKRVKCDVIDIMRVAGGKCVEHWHVMDQLGLLMQLVAVSLPG